MAWVLLISRSGGNAGSDCQVEEDFDVVEEEVERGVFTAETNSVVGVRINQRAEMKAKVLIVDDDVAITQQLFWMLCADYDVMTANDLASAVRRTTIYEPAVVLLDLNLPPTLDSPDSGMRILEYIKGRFAAAKVFIISSASSIETQKACLDGGADGFFSKPLEIESLLSTVRRTALARHHGAV